MHRRSGGRLCKARRGTPVACTHRRHAQRALLGHVRREERVGVGSSGGNAAQQQSPDKLRTMQRGRSGPDPSAHLIGLVPCACRLPPGDHRCALRRSGVPAWIAGNLAPIPHVAAALTLLGSFGGGEGGGGGGAAGLAAVAAAASAKDRVVVTCMPLVPSASASAPARRAMPRRRNDMIDSARRGGIAEGRCGWRLFNPSRACMHVPHSHPQVA